MVCKHIIAGQHQDVNSTSMNFSILWKLDKSKKTISTVHVLFKPQVLDISWPTPSSMFSSLAIHNLFWSDVVRLCPKSRRQSNRNNICSSTWSCWNCFVISSSFPLSHFSWISRCKDSQERLQHHPRHWSQHHRWPRDLKRSSGDVAMLHHGILWWT